MQNLIKQKQVALEKHLIRSGDFNEEELDDLTYQEGWEEFEIGNHNYKVLTDDEANGQTREYIEDSLWAFTPSFLERFTPDGVDEDIIKILQEKCEDCNEALLGMVSAAGRFDELVDGAIAGVGRGHFLSSYDGYENEEMVDDVWYFIYRTN